jgi:hypothetical protein
VIELINWQRRIYRGSVRNIKKSQPYSTQVTSHQGPLSGFDVQPFGFCLVPGSAAVPGEDLRGVGTNRDPAAKGLSVQIRCGAGRHRVPVLT